MATFPLQSCRMGISLKNGWFWRRRETIHGDRAGLRAAIEADTAAGAAVAGIDGGMYAVSVQLRAKLQAFRRTGLNAQSAAFALLDVDQDVASWCCHIHLVVSVACGRCSHLVCSQYA